MVPKEKRKTYNTNTINENQQILKHYLVCILPLIPQVKRCNSNPPPPTLKNIKKMCCVQEWRTAWEDFVIFYENKDPCLPISISLSCSRARSILGTHEINPNKQSWMSHNCIHWSFITPWIAAPVNLRFLFQLFSYIYHKTCRSYLLWKLSCMPRSFIRQHSHDNHLKQMLVRWTRQDH